MLNGLYHLGDNAMAHELATANGRTAMMYAREIPWHGLGTRLDQPATAGEAIEAAGLNYQADLKDIETTDGIPSPQRKAVIRSDSGDVLGVVGTSYVPVQNHQAFGFLDAVVADGNLRYHTAGALGKGERVWMLTKLPDDIRVKNSDDITEPARKPPRKPLPRKRQQRNGERRRRKISVWKCRLSLPAVQKRAES